jgi:hypothetical protein
MYEPSRVDFAVTGEAKATAANVYVELAASGDSEPKHGVADLSPLLRGAIHIETVATTTFNGCDECTPEQRALTCCYLSFCPCVGMANFYLFRGSSDATLRRLSHLSCDIATAAFLLFIFFLGVVVLRAS